MVNLKEQVGIKAAEFVKDGMIVGLGTGSTAYILWLNWVSHQRRRLADHSCHNVECDL